MFQDKNIYNRLVRGLFETRAIRICKEDKPFWYTSGKMGPYYINTHFLFGTEDLAGRFLALIDSVKSSASDLHGKVFSAVLDNYNNDLTYKTAIDDMLTVIRSEVDLSNIGYISGGERRDWFFSFLVAHFLNKPHITIFKDLKMSLYADGQTTDVPPLNGAEVLHVADLITEASSYERFWIPAIKSAGGKITNSIVVVDRKQGGRELLEQNGIKSIAMANVDLELFDKALDMGYVRKSQYVMIKNYIEDPESAMKNFLKLHPDFIASSLASDAKTAERAKLCLEKGFYKI